MDHLDTLLDVDLPSFVSLALDNCFNKRINTASQGARMEQQGTIKQVFHTIHVSEILPAHTMNFIERGDFKKLG